MSIWDISSTLVNLSQPSVINFSSTGDNTIITGVGTTTIRVWRLFLVVSANTNLQFWNGPSASGTSFTGVMSMLANGSITLDLEGDPWFVTSPGNNFVINQSGTAQVSGTAYYSQS